ncbi:MAG: leucyl/phenylalanyl-tRNA--protein transferase [Alphaproteobacteria bacterium]|nr:MAG: leucyl/phenylalanyl-tRNA--protein transferase [Alphaproteobacteria bacterium]
MSRITPELVLHAYTQGMFPMAESGEARDVFWVDPERRGILPLDAFHVSRKLRRLVRREPFRITVNTAFRQVIRCCANGEGERSSTWINATIMELYTALHAKGYAHSIECWEGEDLVGGLYGVALGAAFFGESMFHRRRDASKVALVHLVARLRFGGFTLLDSQFVTPHLRQFGAVEVPREEYQGLLREAVSSSADFFALPLSVSGERVVQLSTQTS